MDLHRNGNMRIFIHPHHLCRSTDGSIKNGYGDPESYPHVHVQDEDGKTNSFSIESGKCLQKDGIKISKKAMRWYEEMYYVNRFAWNIVWEKTGGDWCDDLFLELEPKFFKVKVKE